MKEVVYKTIAAGVYTNVVIIVLLWDVSKIVNNGYVVLGFSVISMYMVWLYESQRQRKTLRESEVMKTELVSKEQFEQVLNVINEFEDTTLRIADLSKKQIETTQEQTTNAIDTLTERFSGLVDQLNTAVSTSQNVTQQFEADHSGKNVRKVFENNKQRLDAVINNREQTRTELLNHVQDLAQKINSLKGMTDQINNIASQTGILALNASIEASRAGKHGTAFSVVANEVRGLSLKTSETVSQITEVVDDISNSMSETIINAMHVSEKDNAKEVKAFNTINEVLEEFLELTEGFSNCSNFLREESIGIRNEISEIMVALQFQDRTHQILTHVCNSFSMFAQGILMAKSQRREGEIKAFSGEDIVEELKKGYSTAEQHRIHEGKSAERVKSQEIEFF